MHFLKTYNEYIYNFLNESLNPKIQELKDYLTIHWKKKKAELEKFGIDNFKNIGELEQSFPEKFRDVLNNFLQFSEKQGGKIKNFTLPGYYFYEFDSVLNNQYLIHFTNKEAAYAIYNSQTFKYGISNAQDINKAHSKDEIIKHEYGYSFAFFWKDIKYAFRSSIDYLFDLKNDTPFISKNLGYKQSMAYGDYSVIFTTPSTVRVYHPINKQYMCIFWGKDAENINLVILEDGKWTIKDKWQKKIIFQNESYSALLNDYMKNYKKYKKQLK